MTDLFDRSEAEEREQPLAARMRPRTLEEFAGQEHILGPGRLLRRAIQADQLSSLIFYGPPGTGKTTLARVIANTTRSHFQTINAVLAGVKDIREATARAAERRKLYGQRTILFVDEVHRWNKAQQDALLPWVENGTIILIGATTENPFFEVNRALVSRSRIFQLKPLSREDLLAIARHTLADRERGYGGLAVRIDPAALDHLVDVAEGDARTLLNALELAVETTPQRFPPPPGAEIHISQEIAEESIQRRVVLYDKEGDYHFDTVSAFIKSLRGSDPDAALYWLARMVYAGEDPRFLFRRMLIFACEDVGLADPQALVVAEAAAAAFDRVGLPEGRFHLAQATLYLATAPKSNTAMAFFDALDTVAQERSGEVPVHLRDASRDAEGFGHGEGYLYPHAYREHWVAQQYLPDRLQGRVFYQPSGQGYEAGILQSVERRREAQLAAMLAAEERPGELLTFTRGGRSRDLWLERTVSQASAALATLRDLILERVRLARHHLVLDLGAREGLLTWEALRRVPEGGVWALAFRREEAELLRGRGRVLEEIEKPRVLEGALMELPRLLAGAGAEAELRFDAAVGRDALLREADRDGALRLLRSLLREGAWLCSAETIPSGATRLSALVGPESVPEELHRLWREAEERMYQDQEGPLLGLSAAGLEAAAQRAGFLDVGVEERRLTSRRRIAAADLERWFAHGRAEERSYASRLNLPAGAIAALREACLQALADREVEWITTLALLSGRKGSG